MGKNECRNIQEYIEDYLEGRLSAEERAEMEEHLNCCPECQQELQSWQALFQGLTSLSHTTQKEQPSPDFTAKLMQKIAQQEPVVTGESFWYKVQHLLTIPSLSLKWTAALAMSLLLVFLGYSVYFSPIEQTLPNCLAEITFTMKADASQVQSIAVVGDFNDWDPNRHLLTDTNHDGIWTVTLKLEPGRYEYMFILDGQHWVPDPTAFRYVNDGFGNKNAVIEISQCGCN